MSKKSGENLLESDTSWASKKLSRPLGGLSEVISIAADLGYPVSASHSQENKGCDFVRILSELNKVQQKTMDLQVELKLGMEDHKVAHLTHVTEMQKKCEILARMTNILKDVIQNKDRIIARLKQPYSSRDCIPVEAEYQKQFSELLMIAASDYGILTDSVSDFQWMQNFKEPPSVWAEMMRPLSVALESCMKFLEASCAMDEEFKTLKNLRVKSNVPP